jgi:hypothetical protein
MTKTTKRKRVSRATRAEAKEGKTKPDPIFAAINVHRTALTAIIHDVTRFLDVC